MNTAKRTWKDRFWALDRGWIGYGLLALAVFVVYSPVLFFDLTYLDDNVWLLDYQWYVKDPANLYKVFIEPDLISRLFFRPLLNISFMVNALVWGEQPWGYHLTNILFHAVNTCLIFTLLKTLDYERRLSWSMALVFGLHPVLTQATAWIPGRTDSFFAMFAFGSMIAFFCFARNPRGITLAAHLTLLLSALLSKETGVGIPAAAGIYVLLSRECRRRWTVYWPAALGWIIVTGGWAVWRAKVLEKGGSAGLDVIVQSVIGNASALLSYGGKILLPVNLSVLPVLKDIRLVYGVLALALLIALLIWKRRGIDKSRVIFGIVWYGLFLTPSLVLSFLKHEYRVYVPMAGLVICLMEVLKNFSLKKTRWILAAVAAVFAVQTVFYSFSFRDRMTFWQEAARTSPHSPLARRNLGAMHYLEGNLEKAETEFLASLELNPRERMVHNNLGLIYKAQGNLEQAERYFLEEIRINPDYDNVYFNLGLLYAQTNRPERAIQAWETCVRLNPKYIEAYKYLHYLYSQMGDKEKAEYYLRELQRRGVTGG